MNGNTLEKTLDTLNSAAKVAANLSESNKNKPIAKERTPVERKDDSNRANQSIQISLDNGKKKEPKPVEKHIHEFPENRPLTEQECELSLKKARMEYELRMNEQLFNQSAYNREWEHKLEEEKKCEKRGKLRRIAAWILGAASVGICGYSVYTDIRDRRSVGVPQRLPEPAPKPVQAVNTEGKVE